MNNITLVQQAENLSNEVTSCSLTLENCTIGNTLILSYAVRGTDNTPTLTDGWELVGGGNVVSSPSGSYQKIYFAKKTVVSTTETVTVTQTTTGRIHLVCGEFSGDFSIVMRDDMANRGKSNFTVTATKDTANDVILYAVSSASYSTSGGRSQSCEPSDLTKLQGNATQERLACWFDDGSGEVNHTFKTCNNTGSYDAIVECVQLIPKKPKYLIRNNDTIYTVSDGALTEVTGTLNAQLFQTYGVEEIPSGTLLITLNNPEVLCWIDELTVPLLKATVQGIPLQPQVIVSEEINLMDGSIKGISGVTVDCKGDVLFAVSFDKKATWMMYNGTEWVAVSDEVTGMTKTVFETVTTEQWQTQYETASDMYIRCILFDETQSITAVNVDFIN